MCSLGRFCPSARSSQGQPMAPFRAHSFACKMSGHAPFAGPDSLRKCKSRLRSALQHGLVIASGHAGDKRNIGRAADAQNQKPAFESETTNQQLRVRNRRGISTTTHKVRTRNLVKK